MAARKLKLYVWTEVLSDYTDGIIFALARDVDEARRVAIESADLMAASVKEAVESKEPKEYDKPIGFYLWGGG